MNEKVFLVIIASLFLAACSPNNYYLIQGNSSSNGSVNLSGYVPYTGATQNVNINGFILQTHGLRSTDSAGLLLESQSGLSVADFGVGNTANVLFYGSSIFSGNICQAGVCTSNFSLYNDTADIILQSLRIDDLNQTKLNVTDQRYNETTQISVQAARVDSLNNTKLNITDQRYNDTAAVNTQSARVDSLNATKLNVTDQRYNESTAIATLSTFAQTKAATGSASSASLCLQNLTVTNNTWTSAYTSCGGAGGGVTSVATGNGLTGGPITSTGTVSVNSPTCAAGEYLRWTGTAFTCSTPAGGSSGTSFSTYNATVHDQTDSSGAATFLNLPNATIYLASNSTYSLECVFMVNSAATTTGIQLRFNTTGTPTNVRYTMTYYTSATAEAICQGTNTATNTCSALASAGTTVTQSRYTGFVRTGANPSVFTVDYATEINTSAATVYAGSYCRGIKTT